MSDTLTNIQMEIKLNGMVHDYTASVFGANADSDLPKVERYLV
ncbi:hypothetical protein CCP3SC15_70026 [Gammaproteobacteria bacterium]